VIREQGKEKEKEKEREREREREKERERELGKRPAHQNNNTREPE